MVKMERNGKVQFTEPQTVDAQDGSVYWDNRLVQVGCLRSGHRFRVTGGLTSPALARLTMPCCKQRSDTGFTSYYGHPARAA